MRAKSDEISKSHDRVPVPNSCGSSWQKTAIAVEMPPLMEPANAAPTARPSVL